MFYATYMEINQENTTNQNVFFKKTSANSVSANSMSSLKFSSYIMLLIPQITVISMSTLRKEIFMLIFLLMIKKILNDKKVKSNSSPY